MEYYEIIDLESIDSDGDCDYWKLVAVDRGQPIAIQWRCSAELDMYHCSLCDSYGHQSDWCPMYPDGTTVRATMTLLTKGWESGRRINAPRWPIDEYPRNWLRVRE